MSEVSGTYERSDGKFGWRIVEESFGNIIATDGGQGYEDLPFCANMYERFVRGLLLDGYSNILFAPGVSDMDFFPIEEDA